MQGGMCKVAASPPDAFDNVKAGPTILLFRHFDGEYVDHVSA